MSVGGVSHHAKMSNPRVGAVRGLLRRMCWARAHLCTSACVLIEEVPFTRVRVRVRVRVKGEGEGEGAATDGALTAWVGGWG